MTVIAEALQRAGYRKHEMQLYPHLQAFFRAGGTMEKLTELAKSASGSVEVDAKASGKAIHDVASKPAVPPARGPSPVQISTARIVRERAARSAFDRERASDGRPWGNVGVHEWDGMERDGLIVIEFKKRVGKTSNIDGFKATREVMTEADFVASLAAARKASHAS